MDWRNASVPSSASFNGFLEYYEEGRYAFSSYETLDVLSAEKEKTRTSLRQRGSVQLNDNGRPRFSTAATRYLKTLWRHEIMFTEAIKKLLHLPWKRGKKVPQSTRPDGVLMLDGNVHMNWEMHMGTQSHRQTKDRMRVYERTEEFVVWVATDKADMEVLMKYASRLRNPLFMHVGDDELVDLNGNTVPLDLLGKSQG